MEKFFHWLVSWAAIRVPGNYGTSSEFYKYGPVQILLWLTNLFNDMLYHEYVTTGLSDVKIRLIINHILQIPSDSGSYRPISISICASELLEKLISQRPYCFLDTSNYQLGLKKFQSTYSLSTLSYVFLIDINVLSTVLAIANSFVNLF